MKGIGRTSVAQYFCVDVSTPGQCVLQLLQHDNTGSLSHDETVSILIEGNGTSGGILAV